MKSQYLIVHVQSNNVNFFYLIVWFSRYVNLKYFLGQWKIGQYTLEKHNYVNDNHLKMGPFCTLFKMRGLTMFIQKEFTSPRLLLNFW